MTTNETTTSKYHDCLCSQVEITEIDGTVSDTGCTVQTKRTFGQGHDAALKGLLIKAGRTGASVALVDGGMRMDSDALGFAQTHLSDRLAAMVEDGINRPKPTKSAKATWADAGEVKVGRWSYPAQSNGRTLRRNTKKDGSGEWVPVA